MKLNTWLKTHSQTDLANRIGVTPAAVNHWKKGIRDIDPRRVIQIEKATKGAITRYEMRPDIYPLD